MLSGAILGDVLRGPLPPELPAPLAQSVRLHRRLDALTDAHPRVAAARRRFPAGARRYAGILLDLLYDHVLASDWSAFSPEPLEAFAERAAHAVASDARWFAPGAAPAPGAFAALLVSYRTDAGFERAVARTARRLRKPQGLTEAMRAWPQQRAAARADLPALLDDLTTAARAFVIVR